VSLRISSAIIRHEYRVMWTDPSTVLFVVVIPLFMVALMKKLFAAVLAQQGFAGANGAEFAVPGMAVGFARSGSLSPASRSFATTVGAPGTGSEPRRRHRSISSSERSCPRSP
jgi:hypothetical protein